MRNVMMGACVVAWLTGCGWTDDVDRLTKAQVALLCHQIEAYERDQHQPLTAAQGLRGLFQAPDGTRYAGPGSLLDGRRLPFEPIVERGVIVGVRSIGADKRSSADDMQCRVTPSASKAEAATH
ncbi:hypothetical protein LYSHEL_00240 [Lysobacter helvus]|uniref:Uncharacterized protein n=2 Tax=Lysobacteraceae TaxID=32033 RepID=A0ABN6FP25_9GAMM|nr:MULTISPECIES: hypothetical protein [Lysobacter]BCT91000.1 hypothetical protein LYSCAS_00240 [Lysobacter caseinilyticus]BCT94153.1 hypothetical protein LYSHEL_00240 [Lysobacter helvus]